jgi:IS605 OrfB family transposase
MKTTGSKYSKGTKKIKKKYEDRNNYIHQASRPIIKQAEEKDVKEIVIGDFRTIKTGNKIKYFVQIPHTRLKEQIKYKGRVKGIKVVEINEAYTSIVSSIDLEKAEKINANKKRRIKRGLFKTSYGIINSDINGSLNILMKYDNYKNIPMLVKKVRDKGYQEYLIRLSVV